MRVPPSSLSRRRFLQAVAAGAGAVAGARLAGGPERLASADAPPPEKSAVVVVHLLGGYNALFCSADSFLSNGAFGVNNGNVMDLGNRLFVDKATLGQFPQYALQHMATIGNRHGSSDHAQSQVVLWSGNGHNYAIQLAAAMGGSAAIKCAAVGEGVQAPTPSEGGVSMQRVVDMSTTIEALVGGDQRSPDRANASRALGAAQKMSGRGLAANPVRDAPVVDGYGAAIDALTKQPPPFDYRSLPTAYGLTGTAINDGYMSKFAGAELMIRAGANVVALYSPNLWDNHGVRTPGVPVGTTERNQMAQLMVAPFQKFLSRVYDPAGLGATHNVVVVIVGDFSRSLPGGDHQPNLSATVIGKYVKVGTTGRVDANVGLPPSCPSSQAMWAYIAAAAKAPGAPFGANPHGLIA